MKDLETKFTWAVEMQLVRYEHNGDGCCVGEGRSDIDTIEQFSSKEEADAGYSRIFDAALDSHEGVVKDPMVESYRVAARRKYQEDGVIEVSDDAVVSVSDDSSVTGVYVQAWVYVELDEV